MFAGCLQIMWAHWQLIRVEGVGYLQLIRAENTDVCRSYGLCLQAVTVSGQQVIECRDDRLRTDSKIHHRLKGQDWR